MWVSREFFYKIWEANIRYQVTKDFTCTKVSCCFSPLSLKLVSAIISYASFTVSWLRRQCTLYHLHIYFVSPPFVHLLHMGIVAFPKRRRCEISYVYACKLVCIWSISSPGCIFRFVGYLVDTWFCWNRRSLQCRAISLLMWGCCFWSFKNYYLLGPMCEHFLGRGLPISTIDLIWTLAWKHGSKIRFRSR